MNWYKKYFIVFIPSFLVAILPVIFLYNHNATKLNLRSILLPLLIMVSIALFITAISMFFNKSSVANATIASIVFLIFFFFYGPSYDYLLKIDVIQIEHVTFLPIFIFIAYIFIKAIQRVSPSDGKYVFVGAELLCGGLILFNIIGIVPTEVRKLNTHHTAQVSPNSDLSESNNILRPDIYYIVLDETAGFDAIRQYWKYEQIDEFENFLKSKGFFVAESSKSKTLATMIEVASRLNMEDMSNNEDFSEQDWYESISNNKVMQIFKQYGYTTVVADQVHSAFGYVNKTPINADYDFTELKTYSDLFAFDEFFYLVFDLSMLRPVADEIYKSSNPLIIQHRNNVLFFFDKLAHLDVVPSPKFIYGQLLLTHIPLIFDKNGDSIDEINHYNWNFYLDSYIFEIKKTTELVNTILDNADPKNPPIIIIQSDHGFRNIRDFPTSVLLTNYPDDLKYHIVNAMLLPGYDISQLPDDLNPIDTFPIILDHYFGENIPLQ